MRGEAERIFDEYLATAAQTGDQAAWERLVVRWQPRLVRHAWRLTGNADLARDMVQEAWVEILRGLRRLDDVAAFHAWAFRIVTRRCQRTFMRAETERRGIAEFTEEASQFAPHTATGEHAAELAKVLALMRALPASQRTTLALFHLDNLSVAEIAVALDVPVGTVKTRLMHARRKIREQLEGETMRNTDQLIEQALSVEDRELLAKHGEPNYLNQAFGLFQGSLGWVAWLTYLTGIVAFAGCAYALWQTWTTTDPLLAVRWGVVAVLLFQCSAMLKAYLGSHMQANRTLRELKRVEVQLSLLRDARPDNAL